jgi:DNA primase large subunit
MEFGSDDLARYPFLPEVGEFVRGMEISVSALSGPDYDEVVRRAEERVVEAIEKREVSYPFSDAHPKNESDKAKFELRPKVGQTQIEMLSFPISLALVKATKLDHLVNMYSLAEAKRAVKLLQTAQTSKYGDHEITTLLTIFRRVFGIQVDLLEADYHDTHFAISVPDYVKRASKFHKEEWKLVNKPVNRGKVILDRQDLVRLVGDEIQAMIAERLKAMPPGTKLPENLQEIVKNIVKMAPPAPQSPYTTVHIAPENYPPCVRRAIDLLDKGENVPHYGRFLMATYLLSVGKSVDEIVAMFPKAPDFKQNVTRYQVEHLAGLKGSRTRYRVPSCKTLQTHQFCFMDPVKCYQITSPLQYPSRKKKDLTGETQGRTSFRAAKEKVKNKERSKRDWMKPQRS